MKHLNSYILRLTLFLPHESVLLVTQYGRFHNATQSEAKLNVFSYTESMFRQILQRYIIFFLILCSIIEVFIKRFTSSYLIGFLLEYINMVLPSHCAWSTKIYYSIALSDLSKIQIWTLKTFCTGKTPLQLFHTIRTKVLQLVQQKITTGMSTSVIHHSLYNLGRTTKSKFF